MLELAQDAPDNTANKIENPDPLGNKIASLHIFHGYR
jgi:hypothetical protein